MSKQLQLGKKRAADTQSISKKRVKTVDVRMVCVQEAGAPEAGS